MNVTLGPGEAVVIRSGLPTDVASRVRIKAGPVSAGEPHSQFVAISNVSTSTIDGPLYLVADGLASGATLTNASGVVGNLPPAGVPYIRVLDAGQSLGAGVAMLAHLNWSTNGGTVSYSPRVLAGPGAP